MKTLDEMTEPQLKHVMLAAIQGAKRALPPNSMLMVLAWDGHGVAQYVSNCERADMIKALRETADRLERKEDVSRVPFPGEN